MRHSRKLYILPGLALLILAGFLLAGCSSPGSPGAAANPGAASVKTSTPFIAFPGNATATFTVTASSSWKASTNQPWFDPQPFHGF